MSDGPPLETLARTAVLYGGGLTLWLVATAVRTRTVEVHQRAAAGLFWLASTAVAIAHLAGVLGDRAGHDVAVSVAYAVTAVLVMPILWLQDDTGGARVPALATGVTTVLVLRLGAVW